MADYDILIAVYPTEDGAKKTVDQLKQMEKDKIVDIIDAATMVKESYSGKVKVDELSLPHPKKGAKWGAIVGAVVGVIFPPGLIASTLVGAGIGAGGTAVAKHIEKDKDLQAFLQESAESLEPGTSAVIAVIEDRLLDTLKQGLSGYDKLMQKQLDADAVAALGIEAG